MPQWNIRVSTAFFSTFAENQQRWFTLTYAELIYV